MSLISQRIGIESFQQKAKKGIEKGSFRGRYALALRSLAAACSFLQRLPLVQRQVPFISSRPSAGRAATDGATLRVPRPESILI